MFKSALQKFDISKPKALTRLKIFLNLHKNINFKLDVKKMPLGKLSKTQIAKGFEVLEEIEDVLKSNVANKSTKINDLSSKFYTVIPQDFGRSVPPAINNEELLQKKYDMLIGMNCFFFHFIII